MSDEGLFSSLQLYKEFPRAMIGYLRGNCILITEDTCVIDVNGVGYRVFCSEKTINHLQKTTGVHSSPVKLYTQVIHREDTMDLYGFLQNDEHELFNLLLSVNGIGPKQSLKILGFNDVGDIVKAIISEDSGYLESLPGIGKKKAQQIILELKEKARKNFDMAAIPLSSHNIEAIAALESLGFSPKEARSAVEKALATEGVKTGDVGTIVESALKLLS